VVAPEFIDGGQVSPQREALSQHFGIVWLLVIVCPERIFRMFIAMNRFKVRKGAEQDFEQVWLTRDSHLKTVPGFIAFHLLKGPEKDDHVLYASHSLWRSETAFLDWTRSEAFRKAHAGAGTGKSLYLGHPELEAFTVIQEVRAERKSAAE
jgi:heme-degrading monooxygenase HmoA